MTSDLSLKPATKLRGDALVTNIQQKVIDPVLYWSRPIENNPGAIMLYPYLTMQMDNSFATREVYLTVRYRFNSAKDKYKGTGAGSETFRRL